MDLTPIDAAALIAYADLVDRCLDASFEADFPPGQGHFIAKAVKGQKYWYFQRNSPGGQKQIYVGPDRDPAIATRVSLFKDQKADFIARRSSVAMLKAARLPAPDVATGALLEALAMAGVFRLRAVLIGTTAFPCYAGLLGVRLPASLQKTADVDLAQFQAISLAVQGETAPMLATLKALDPSFREIPHPQDARHTHAFIAASGLRVEFLTPMLGSDDSEGKPVPLRALPGVAAQSLRFLDFLIHEPARAVILHKAGVAVLVPAPERYAVHKLILASRRRDALAKRDKDIAQAKALIAALKFRRMGDVLQALFEEAVSRGPAWRAALEPWRAEVREG